MSLDLSLSHTATNNRPRSCLKFTETNLGILLIGQYTGLTTSSATTEHIICVRLFTACLHISISYWISPVLYYLVQPYFITFWPGLQSLFAKRANIFGHVMNIAPLMDITKMGSQMANIEEMATLNTKKRWNEPTICVQ